MEISSPPVISGNNYINKSLIKQNHRSTKINPLQSKRNHYKESILIIDPSSRNVKKVNDAIIPLFQNKDNHPKKSNLYVEEDQGMETDPVERRGDIYVQEDQGMETDPVERRGDIYVQEDQGMETDPVERQGDNECIQFEKSNPKFEKVEQRKFSIIKGVATLMVASLATMIMYLFFFRRFGVDFHDIKKKGWQMLTSIASHFKIR